jgi:hypothetical protein
LICSVQIYPPSPPAGAHRQTESRSFSVFYRF